MLLVRLGGQALWDDDEPKNAACSLAMLDAGDWVVPTFNGRLRIEKPPLVNWLQIAGFTAFGRNETGARIGSALLTGAEATHRQAQSQRSNALSPPERTQPPPSAHLR